MSNAAKLKKKAVELEQKKQFDKALALYIQFLQESDGALDDVDVPLYNRVGDLLLRTGNASDALNYYEKAVDLYADRGFLNNAIALCNKVLRQSPGRASIYYKLGKISATKGFKSDAKKNFLEYADRMQKAGQINEAFRALKEFADLCPDQDDIRLMLAEQLTKENRQDEALEQLQKLHDKLDSEGRTAEARATVDRMKSIDPEAVPRVSGSYRPQKATDLIFLDTSFEQTARMKASPVPPPPGRQVTEPDLVVLTFADEPNAAVSPVENEAISGAFQLDAPNDAPSTQGLPLLDVGGDLPSAAELVAAFDVDTRSPAAEPAAAASLDFEMADDMPEVVTASREPTPVDFMTEPSASAGGPPLSGDYAGDLSVDVNAPIEPDGGDLFDFRAPPRSDNDPADAAQSFNLDPDVAFPSLDVGDISLPSADEITSGGSLAAALGADATLGMELDGLDVPAAGAIAAEGADETRSRDESEPASDSGERFELEWSAPVTAAPPTEADPSAIAASIDDMIVDASETTEVVDVARATPSDVDVMDAVAATAPAADAPPSDDLIDVSVDDLIDATPRARDEYRTDTRAETPRQQSEATGEMEVVAPPEIEPAARQQTPAAEPAVAEAAPIERMAGWEMQRADAERLLEAGDRAGGVQMLEQVAAELERIGDLERALTIVDELIRLSPDSIRNHQKRVELAFRANDRGKLIDAYLELGDALFRSGEERKARAVYQRVLELAPDDPRARAAVESVSSMSPPTGSGAIPTISSSAPPADTRQAPPPQRPARDSHIAPPPAANGARAAGGITVPPQSRKPSPLDRSAAANGEFVDLGEWLRSGESPKSTRMVAEEKPPTGDEQADFQEMLKRFKQGVAENVDEEDFESHYDLGVAYKEMGLIDEAVAEFQKALRGQTNRVRSYEALGQCFVEKEQYLVAASVLSRAIALGEGDDHHLVGVLYLLGRATEALSRDRDALDYYQRVFAVDIEFRDVAERISAIERKAT